MPNPQCESSPTTSKSRVYNKMVLEKPAENSTRPLVPQIPPVVDWVPLVQLNHPPVPVPLPIHHVVAPDDDSEFSSGTTWGTGVSSSTGLLCPLLNTSGVGGVLCVKHHCFTRASCNSDEGNSVINGDIGPVGDDRLWLGVDDEDDEAEVLTEEVSEGGSGEATLGGVDRGEERGDMNMGMSCLKMGAKTSILDLISFDQIRTRVGSLTFRFWLWVKRKRLGYFLQAARTTPWRRGSLDRGSNPDGRGDEVGRFLRSRGKSDAPRDAATLSQGEPRDLIKLIGR